MIIAIDMGNTTIEFALIDENDLEKNNLDESNTKESNKIHKKFYIKSKPLDIRLLHNNLKNFLQDINYKNIPFVISSVVPENNPSLQETLSHYTNNIHLLKSSDFANKIKSRSRISEIGMDIICKTIWVSDILKENSIVVDIGTATVLQYVTRDAEIKGASISLGLASIYSVLNSSTSLLPLISPQKADTVLGSNTVECIQRGVYWGYVGTIEKLISKAVSEIATQNIFITGGLSELVLEGISLQGINIKINKNIIFEGIVRAFKISNKT